MASPATAIDEPSVPELQVANKTAMSIMVIGRTPIPAPVSLPIRETFRRVRYEVFVEIEPGTSVELNVEEMLER